LVGHGGSLFQRVIETKLVEQPDVDRATRAQRKRDELCFASDVTDAAWALIEPLLPPRAPATPDLERRLGKLCGNGPELWLNRQSHYDVARLSKIKRAEISAIPTLGAE
jgi:hypothetical protein